MLVALGMVGIGRLAIDNYLPGGFSGVADIVAKGTGKVVNTTNNAGKTEMIYFESDKGMLSRFIDLIIGGGNDRGKRMALIT
ncbi:MAG: hypothetical protein ACI9LO_002663 [Planctomycetota bacterium]|jgi:hypothetical protein